MANKILFYKITEKHNYLFTILSRSFATQPNLKEAPTTKFEEEWKTALPYEEIPGPSKLTLLRRFLPTGKYYGMDRKELYKSLREEYGEVLKLPGLFGKASLVFTFNPNTFEKIYRNEGVWPHRQSLETLVHYREIFNPKLFRETGSLVATNGELWGKFRSMVNPVLMQPKTIGIYAPKMNEVANEFINRIKVIKDPQTNEAPANFEREMNNWAIESVCLVGLETRLNVISGKSENSEETADVTLLIESLDKIFKLPIDLDFKPSIWKWYETSKFKELMRAFDDLTRISEKYINQALKRIQNRTNDSAAGESVLERLVKINENIAVVMALEMFFAGVDTTTSALTSCLLSLSKNPDKQEILRKEIMNAMPSKDTIITKEILNNMPYLKAVIKESYRANPVVFEQSRGAGVDLVLDGYQLPKGTEIIMIPDGLAKSDSYFSNANKFLPERWLRNPNNVAATTESKCPVATKSSNPFVFLPFGFGPRMCIGKRLVDMEIEIVLMQILRNFKVEFDYPDENVFKLELIYTPDVELKFKFIDI